MTRDEVIDLARATAAKRRVKLCSVRFAELITESKLENAPPSIVSRVGQWLVMFHDKTDKENIILGEEHPPTFWIDDTTRKVEWTNPPLSRLLKVAMTAWFGLGLLIVIPIAIVSAPFALGGMFYAEWRKPKCPRCRRRLRTMLAQQCFHCGLDWHDAPMPTRAEARSLPLNRS